MQTIDLIPPDPTHVPGGRDSQRAILYPLWALEIEIRLLPKSEPRVLHFSVDGVRSVPLPIKGMPETVPQELRDGMRLLDGIDRERAEDVTRHFTKKGIGKPASLVARIKFTDAQLVYKLFWLVDDDTDQAALIDSRSGKRIPMPSEFAEEPAAE